MNNIYKIITVAIGILFLFYFIHLFDELPKIKEVLAEQLVEPTVVYNTLNSGEKNDDTDETVALAVTDGGELIVNLPAGQAGKEQGEAEEN